MVEVDDVRSPGKFTLDGGESTAIAALFSLTSPKLGHHAGRHFHAAFAAETPTEKEQKRENQSRHERLCFGSRCVNKCEFSGTVC